MPLSEPAAREQVHRRSIEICGYNRDDGLFDIEAHLTDLKNQGFESADRGRVPPGIPLHEMWLRLTIDEDMRIHGCEAVTDHGPFRVCGGGAATMTRLVGLTIGPGFLKDARQRLGGVEGCTHLREMLQQVATTAYQTLWPVLAKRQAAREPPLHISDKAQRRAGSDASAMLLNTCHAYASSSPVVKQRWPELWTGPDAVHPGEGEAPQLAAAVRES